MDKLCSMHTKKYFSTTETHNLDESQGVMLSEIKANLKRLQRLYYILEMTNF